MIISYFAWYLCYNYIINLYIYFLCVKDEVADNANLGEEHQYEISESMRQEMEYDADRAW